MSGPKAIVSTALDPDVLMRLDKFCDYVHRTRAEVIRGLLYALLIEGKQFIFDEWRASAKSESSTHRDFLRTRPRAL